MSFLSSPVQALAFADKLKLYVRASVKEASASNVVNVLSRDSLASPRLPRYHSFGESDGFFSRRTREGMVASSSRIFFLTRRTNWPSGLL